MSLKRDRDPPSAAAAGENKRHKSSSHNSSNVAATSSSLDTGLETNETDLPTFSSSSSSSSSSTTTITANPVISRNLAHQLLYGKHNRFFFPLIFKYLSPNQSERIELRSFCKFFRSMQLSSTLFAVCIIHIKPQFEKILCIPSHSLTKKLELNELLMKLFIEFQIPSDLLSSSSPCFSPKL